MRPGSPAGRARAYLASPQARDLVDRAWAREREPLRELYRELGGRGLLVPHWPREYGGAGAPKEDTNDVYQELVLAGVPDTPYVLGAQIVGEFLLGFADPSLAAGQLPHLAAGTRFASVLYSEPHAGSDLAGLRTTATREADAYLLRGTKVFSLYSWMADVALVAARLDDPQGNRYAGITLFLLDLDQPGVTVEILPGVQDEPFCRVVLDGARVPASHVVGTPGGGWHTLEQALDLERTGIDHAARAQAWLTPLLGSLPAAADDDTRWAATGRLVLRTDLAWILSRQVSEAPTPVGRWVTATAKTVASEVARDVAEAAYLLTGHEEHGRAVHSALREAPGLTLSAGTTEMMREMFLAELREGDFRILDGRTGTIDPEVHDAAAACVATALHRDRRPAVDDRYDEARAQRVWRALADARLPLLELTEADGGFGLGRPAGIAVCEALGAAGLEDPWTPGIRALTGPDRADPVASALLAGELAAVAAPDAGHAPPGTPASYVVDPPASSALDLPALDWTLHRCGHLIAGGLGLLRTAFEHAAARQQFGGPLLDRQAVAHPLAASAMDLTASRAYLHHLARLPDDDLCRTPGLVAGLGALVREQVVTACRVAVQAVGTAGLTTLSDAGARRLRLLAQCHDRHAGDAWSGVGRDLVRGSTGGPGGPAGPAWLRRATTPVPTAHPERRDVLPLTHD